MGAIISIGILGSLIWSFYDPRSASLTYLCIILLFEGYIFWASKYDCPDQLEPLSEPFYLTADEVDVVKKYHLHFKFPMASQQFAGALTLTQLLMYVWVPWLLYSKLWIAALIIFVNYYVAGLLARVLSPQAYLKKVFHSPIEGDSVKQLSAMGKAGIELNAIRSAFEKFRNYDESIHEALE